MFGLVRSADSAKKLQVNEIVPVLGASFCSSLVFFFSSCVIYFLVRSGNICVNFNDLLGDQDKVDGWISVATQCAVLIDAIGISSINTILLYHLSYFLHVQVIMTILERLSRLLRLLASRGSLRYKPTTFFLASPPFPLDNFPFF